MRRAIVLAAAVFILAGCGTDPVVTEQESVNNVRTILGATSDQQARDLLNSTCDALDVNSPQEIVDKADMPTSTSIFLIINASNSFCPEHSEAVQSWIPDR